MKTEHQIRFSADMIRAIRAGNKTQTRRVVKPQPKAELVPDILGQPTWYDGGDVCMSVRCPYGTAGHALWVRETWGLPHADRRFGVLYRADCTTPEQEGEAGVDRWRPSIHMPRWASRITLDVLSVRVERVQDIGEEDAKAEGIQKVPYGWGSNSPGWHMTLSTPVEAFACLWGAINGPRGYGWDANPWVWVIEFARKD